MASINFVSAPIELRDRVEELVAMQAARMIDLTIKREIQQAIGPTIRELVHAALLDSNYI